MQHKYGKLSLLGSLLQSLDFLNYISVFFYCFDLFIVEELLKTLNVIFHVIFVFLV